MAVETLSSKDKEFLARWEEELKHRYTEKDEEFMKVFNAEPCKPPIVEPWWVSQNTGRRNDRGNNRRSHPYERYGTRGRDQDRRDSHDRQGYSNYHQPYDRRQGYRRQHN